MATILNTNVNRAIDINGMTVPGALATFYDSGTSTVREVYADPAATVPHPSPLPANGAGVFPPVYDAGSSDAKVAITDANGVMLAGYPVDPVARISTDITGATSVAFEPTPEIPEDNVQAAIERVQQNAIEPLADFGLGVTGNATLLANINATNIASGAYRYDGTTAGTFPSGVVKANGGTVRLWRENAASALMVLTPNGAVNQSIRELSGAWGVWRRVMSDTDTASNSTWAAGTSTTPYVVSPANVAAAVGAQAVGVGQNWFLTAGRTLDTIYTNDTGRPIQIIVVANGSASIPSQINVRKTPSDGWVTIAEGGADLMAMSAVIPAGQQYRARGGDGLLRWAELR